MTVKPYSSTGNEKRVKESIAGIDYLLNKAGQDSKNIIGEISHKLILTQTHYDECSVKFTDYQEKATSLMQLQRDNCLEEINTLKDFYSTLQGALQNEETQWNYCPEACDVEKLEERIKNDMAQKFLEDKQKLVDVIIQTYEEEIRKINAIHEIELENAIHDFCEGTSRYIEHTDDFAIS